MDRMGSPLDDIQFLADSENRFRVNQNITP
jgi:hypothetical protein